MKIKYNGKVKSLSDIISDKLSTIIKPVKLSDKAETEELLKRIDNLKDLHKKNVESEKSGKRIYGRNIKFKGGYYNGEVIWFDSLSPLNSVFLKEVVLSHEVYRQLNLFDDETMKKFFKPDLDDVTMVYERYKLYITTDPKKFELSFEYRYDGEILEDELDEVKRTIW